MPINPVYGYAWEKLAAARRALMAPHPGGEARAFAGAFHECLLGLQRIPWDELDRDARAWADTIKRATDTTGIEDPLGRGTWEIKAEQLSEAERAAFSRAVDDLADWLRSHYHGQDD